MGKGRGPVRGALWLALLLGLVGCQPYQLPGAQPVGDYPGTWEYRYGDAPGIPSDGFQATRILENPPGRDGSKHLWMRTRLVGPKLHDAVLFCLDIDQSYEAYIDGVLIDRFGPMTGSHYPGLPKIYLPLGADYAGKLLVLRIYSPYSYIGIFGTPQLGGRNDVVVSVIEGGLSPAITGIVLGFLGFAALMLYLLRLQDPVYLYYAGFALGMGAHIIGRSEMREFIMDLGRAWAPTELSGGAIGWASIAMFVAQVFSSGRKSGLHRLGLFLLLAWLVSAGLVAAGVVHVWSLKWPLEFVAFIIMVWVAATAIAATRRGEADGKILAVGLLLGISFAVWDLLILLSVVPQHPITVSHYGSASVVLSLAVLLSLRFLRIHRRLQNYSTVLQLSMSQARILEPGQHMQVALGEVLRLLGGQRALLFEASLERKDFVLMTGRSSRGEALGREVEWDSTLIGDVQRQQRPQVVLRERQSADVTADRPPHHDKLSIAAAPLLARGELLGALYLESEATRHIYGKEDMEILLGLCNQVALALMTTRAVQLELEGALVRRKLAEHDGLLQAAGKMAAGDLDSVITVPPGELEALAKALDAMRKDLQVKFHKLEQSNAEIQSLNEELRRQIEHRSRRLMEIMLRGERKGLNSSANQIAPGGMLGEHYQVLRTLGKGAMGSVFEVERTTDQLRLAAKVLSEQSDRTSLLRFAREAQILARLDHPNLVAITDIDVTPNGVLFLVMELVRGTTLRLCRERYRDLAFAIHVIRQIAAGLHAIHTCGIIHRGLSSSPISVENWTF